MKSQDVVIAAAFAFGVPELDDENVCRERRASLQSAVDLTDGQSFDVVTSAGGDRGFESWRKLHKRCGVVTTASEVT